MNEDTKAENNETPKTGEISNIGTANIIYILYLVAPLVGITGIIGLVMAYINRSDDTPEWVNTHYTYQIHTFWKGMLFSVIGFILTFIIIGIFLLIGVMIWMIIRCVKGMKAFNDGQAIENPKGWWI